MGETVSPRVTDSARLIRVIETKSARGKGTQEDLCRIVTQYWDLNGKLLAENDPQREEELRVIKDNTELQKQNYLSLSNEHTEE